MASFGDVPQVAEIAGEYLKGSKIYVEGKLQTRKWQDQSGQDRYTTEIVVNEMQMLDARGQGQSQGQGQGQPQYQQSAPTAGYISYKQHNNLHTVSSREAIKSRRLRAQPQQASGVTPNLNEGWDDDIPF